tara:strand:+ start:775 stop:1023 length:249 start_codon:yes stop_codon:yes gene_type:complete
LGFFGLTAKDKATIHDQIFQILYYSQGGFTHDDVYCMPVYLRNFYYKKLGDAKQSEQKEIEKAQQKNKSKISRPSINPRFKR